MKQTKLINMKEKIHFVLNLLMYPVILFTDTKKKTRERRENYIKTWGKFVYRSYEYSAYFNWTNKIVLRSMEVQMNVLFEIIKDEKEMTEDEIYREYGVDIDSVNNGTIFGNRYKYVLTNYILFDNKAMPEKTKNRLRVIYYILSYGNI